jgi:hypothetical protein
VCGFHDRGDLGYSGSGHDAGGTDRAWSDAHLDSVCTGFSQRFGSFCRAHITGYDLEIPEIFLNGFQGIYDTFGMAVGTVQADYVNPVLLERSGPVQHV